MRINYVHISDIMIRKTAILTMSILVAIMISPFSIMPSANADSIGEIHVWTGSTSAIPSDFLLADGSAISRTTYSDLFAVIGTTFGTGDGSTTFNIPDFVTDNKFPRAATGDSSLGDTGGSETHQHTIEKEKVDWEVTTATTSIVSGYRDRIDKAGSQTSVFTSSKSVGYNHSILDQQGTTLGPNPRYEGVSELRTQGQTLSSINHEPPYLDIHYIIRHAESSSGSQSQIDTNTTNIASLNSTVIQLTSDIAILQSQIISLNTTLNTLDSEVTVIDTLVDYIDTFLDGILLNYEP